VQAAGATVDVLAGAARCSVRARVADRNEREDQIGVAVAGGRWPVAGGRWPVAGPRVLHQLAIVVSGRRHADCEIADL
jgi:hypothetical protein